MCNTKIPAGPAPAPAAPVAPLEMARIIKPSKTRAKRRETGPTPGDALTALRIPLQIPGAQ